MKVIQSVKDMQTLNSEDLAFVPTMGALHEGHLELIRVAKSKHKNVAVSIFVNPTQFNNPDDLANYPNRLEEDQEKLKALDVDVLFLPRYEDLYKDNYRFKIQETQLSKNLCGAHRPGHFDGVLSVVMKLLNIVKPTEAFFGEKDFQQFMLIKDMAESFFLNTKISSVPTVREDSGLALSSRNLLLTEDEKIKAPMLFRMISDKNKGLKQIKDELEREGFLVDYLEENDGRRFVAAHLGKVRLIDNVSI